MQANTPWEMLPSLNGTRSAPRNSTRFAAQYSARGLPCERFTAALASRTSCITRGRGGWLDLPRGGLSPPILCQLSWRTPFRVMKGRSKMSAATAASPKAASATTSLFLEPVAHPIERFDHVERIYGLLEFLSQSLDVTVDCTIIYINLIIVGGIHHAVPAFDPSWPRLYPLHDLELATVHLYTFVLPH